MKIITKEQISRFENQSYMLRKTINRLFDGRIRNDNLLNELRNVVVGLKSALTSLTYEYDSQRKKK